MSDVDDFTELVDFIPDRVDLVGKAANGTEILVAKSAEGEQVGLFGPEFVRELVAKAEADEQPTGGAPDSVTLSGSPAAIAKMIHDAAVAKAKMSRADINDLPDSAFAYIEPGGKKDAEGKTVPRRLRHFPVHDKAHADDAASRIAQGAEFGEQAKAKVEAAQRRFGEKPVSKALIDGTGTAAADPGSPAWESQDAASGQQAVDQILACIPALQRLAQREAAEVGAGHLDDMCDVVELQAAIDQLVGAAKTVGAFAVSERAEAASVAKAQDAPQPAAPAAPVTKESIVSETETASQAGTETVAKAALTDAERAAIDAKVAKKAAKRAYKAQVMKAAAAQTSGAEGAPADNARTIPGTDTVQAPAATDDVAKAQASQFAAVLSEVMAPVVKQLGELTTQAKDQQERVEKAMQRPDDRNSPALNGATGTMQVADRTYADSPVNSPEFQAVTKALEELPEGEVRDAARGAVAVAAIKARFGG